MGKNIDTMNIKRDTLWHTSMEIGVEVTQRKLSASIYLCIVMRMQEKIIVWRRVRKKALIFFISDILFVEIKPLHQWSPWTFLICHLADVSTIVHSKKADIYVHLRLWAVIEVFVAEGKKLSFITNVCWNVWQNICGCEYCLIMGKTIWRSWIRRRRLWC